MASIDQLEKHRQFFDELMTFLPENEANIESNPENNVVKPVQPKQIPTQVPASKTPTKPKSKPKPNNIRPGFEGPKIIRKKKSE